MARLSIASSGYSLSRLTYNPVLHFTSRPSMKVLGVAWIWTPLRHFPLLIFVS